MAMWNVMFCGLGISRYNQWLYGYCGLAIRTTVEEAARFRTSQLGFKHLITCGLDIIRHGAWTPTPGTLLIYGD